MAVIDRDEFHQWMQLLQKGQEGISARLDVLNGRTRENELAIAVLQDRSEGKRGALWGGGVGTALIVIAEVARYWLGK